MGWEIKNKTLIFGLISISLTTVLLTIVYGDYTNPRRMLYFRSASKITPAYFFGYLPTGFYKNYTQKVVDSTRNFQLLMLSNNKITFETHCYGILKSKKDPFVEEILRDGDSMFYQFNGRSNWLSSQINLEVFNKYVADKNISESNDLLNTYLFIVSGFKSLRYTRIKDKDEYADFISSIDTINSGVWNMRYDSSFIPDFNNCHYIHLPPLGLFELKFEVVNKRVVSVSDENIFVHYML